MKPHEYIQFACQEMIARQNRMLEEQAQVFIKMGYSIDELTVVVMPDGCIEVSPKTTVS